MGLSGAVLAIWVVVALAVVIWARRPVSEHELKLWATAYGLTLTAANWPVAVAYLERVKRGRRLGFAVGCGALAPLATLIGDGPVFVFLLLPYSVSIVLAEAVQRRPPVTGTADLEPRTLDRYLPVRLVWIPRVVLVVVLAIGIGSLWVDDPTRPAWTMSRPTVVGYLLAGVVLHGIGEILERSVVRRRQPAGSPDLLAADDAMRAHAAHAVAGALISIHSCLLLVAAARPAQAGVLNPAFDVVMLVVPLVGMGVGVWYQGRAWRVRRTAPPPPASPPPPVGARA